MPDDFEYFTDGATVYFCDPEFGDQKVCECFRNIVMSAEEVATDVAAQLNKAAREADNA